MAASDLCHLCDICLLIKIVKSYNSIDETHWKKLNSASEFVIMKSWLLLIFSTYLYNQLDISKK